MHQEHDQRVSELGLLGHFQRQRPNVPLMRRPGYKIANSLMPVIILNYPAQDDPVLSTLYWLIPLCDTIKYSVHGLAWLIILFAWAKQLADMVLSRKNPSLR